MTTSPPKLPTPLAMQTRCLACGREQYAMAVWSVSRGEGPCAWCGVVGVAMTELEYRERVVEMAAMADSEVSEDE